MKLTAAVFFATLGALAQSSTPAPAATCENLASLKLSDAIVTTAETVRSGSFTPPEGPAIRNLPAFCRIAGTIKPSSDSDIRFEVWMPVTDWNGKFQGVGNGGFAGSIGYGGLGDAVSHGYATAATDTGHRAGGTDASWALGHPDKIADFGYRAIHETAARAKEIIKAYYRSNPKRSYFSSCSDGGREALMEAQRFPADYDGIIAGAPAYDWTRLLATAIWDMNATLKEPASYIPARKIPAVAAATVAACDANDGVKDGVIDNPDRCGFDPATMECRGADSDACLTAPQVSALKKIYGGLRNSKGEQLFPGYSPGGEVGPGGWGLWITGGAPEKSLMYAFGTQYFKNMVFDNPTWDFRTFNVDHDVKFADDKTGSRLSATNPDLSAFDKRGGKLILYHGWSDAAIPPLSTVHYYERVVSKMGQSKTSGFVRLFMVPGMQHCGGGPGPSDFGQFGVPHGDADRDVAAALERWVEQGTAPERIVAAKHKNGPASEVVRTRPLCAYPKVAQWTGSGSTDDAANFVCVSRETP